MSRMLVWSTRRELNSCASPSVLVPKCANHNRLATLHLKYVNCLVFLTTYMRIVPSKSKNVEMLDSMVNVSKNAISTWALKELLKNHFYQNTYLWCSCQVCIEVVNINWGQHPHVSSQYTKNMTTSPFWQKKIAHSNHLKIARLMSLWVGIHVGFSYLIADEWVRQGSCREVIIHQP